MLVTSSQVLRGPSPMMENSSKPPLRLATALPETGTGMAGNLGSPDAPRRIAAPSTSRTKADSFFIPEILPHVQWGSVEVRSCRFYARVVMIESTADSSALPAAWRGCEGVGMTTSEPGFLEPGFAAVLAVSVSERGFENLGFAAGAQGLHDNESEKDEPEDRPVEDQHKSGEHDASGNVNRIAYLRIDAVRD